MEVIKKEVVYKETHVILSTYDITLLKQILRGYPNQETEEHLDSFAYNLYCKL